MLIPSKDLKRAHGASSLSRRVNANSQQIIVYAVDIDKLIKKGEC